MLQKDMLHVIFSRIVLRMEHVMKIRWDRALMLFSIIVGAVPIGLILIDHKHCG